MNNICVFIDLDLIFNVREGEDIILWISNPVFECFKSYQTHIIIPSRILYGFNHIWRAYIFEYIKYLLHFYKTKKGK